MESEYEIHEHLDTLPPQFHELLKHPLAIYKFSIKNGYVIYLSNVGKIEHFSHIRTNSLGYIEFVLPENILDRTIPDHEKDSTLLFIKVNKDVIKQQVESQKINYPEFVNLNSTHLGKGVGTFLILIYAYMVSLYGNCSISLDDDSDMARNNSIYEQLGCKYDVEDSNEPEMTCDPKKVIRNFKKFYYKYVNNGVFTKLPDDIEPTLLPKSMYNTSMRFPHKSRNRSRSRSRSRSRNRSIVRTRSIVRSRSRSRSRSRGGSSITQQELNTKKSKKKII